MKYDIENSFLLRSPMLPLNTYLEILNAENWQSGLLSLYERPIVKEAIYLGSESLSEALEKVVNQSVKVSGDSRLWFALLKYTSRMSTRATPFGLFAGVADLSKDNWKTPLEQ